MGIRVYPLVFSVLHGHHEGHPPAHGSVSGASVKPFPALQDLPSLHHNTLCSQTVHAQP